MSMARPYKRRASPQRSWITRLPASVAVSRALESNSGWRENSASVECGSTAPRRPAQASAAPMRCARARGGSAQAFSSSSATRATAGASATRVTVYGLRGECFSAWLSGGTDTQTSPCTSAMQARR